MNELVTVTEHDGKYEVVPADCEIKSSTAVVAGIGQLEGRDGQELTPPLAEYVDPGALDRMIDGLAAGAGGVQFTAWGYHVTIEPGQMITLEPGHTGPRVSRSEPASDG